MSQQDLVSSLRSKARRHSSQTSRFRGVSLLKQTGKWHAQINFGGKQLHLGFFAVEEAAARAFDRAAIFKAAAEKGPLATNFDLGDYAPEIARLQKMTQRELLTLLAEQKAAGAVAGAGAGGSGLAGKRERSLCARGTELNPPESRRRAHSGLFRPHCSFDLRRCLLVCWVQSARIVPFHPSQLTSDPCYPTLFSAAAANTPSYPQKRFRPTAGDSSDSPTESGERKWPPEDNPASFGEELKSRLEGVAAVAGVRGKARRTRMAPRRAPC